MFRLKVTFGGRVRFRMPSGNADAFHHFIPNPMTYIPQVDMG